MNLRAGMSPSSGIILVNLSLNLDFNSRIMYSKNGKKILNHSLKFLLMLTLILGSYSYVFNDHEMEEL